ncbi:MAG: PrsW family intramembrane metalloprotease [Bacteroidota bacterium]
MVLLIASAFPVVIFLYMIFQKDHEKEPLALLAKCLFGGFISIPISLAMSFPLSKLSFLFQGDLLVSFHESFFEAAIPEEIAKFTLLYLLIWKSKELNHHYDGIVYAVFVSLGFALIENILYVMDGGMEVAVARAVLAVPGHGFDGVLMGYYFSLARFHEGNERRIYLFKSLWVPILFHGIYDFLLFYMAASMANTSILIFLILLIIFGWFVIKLWRIGFYKIKKHLEKDSSLATIST